MSNKDASGHTFLSNQDQEEFSSKSKGRPGYTVNLKDDFVLNWRTKMWAQFFLTTGGLEKGLSLTMGICLPSNASSLALSDFLDLRTDKRPGTHVVSEATSLEDLKTDSTGKNAFWDKTKG